MYLLGGGSKSMHAGRLLAVLWLFCASFAMQAIAVGQSVSSRFGAGAQTGDVAAPDSGSSNRPAARQLARAVALPDVRTMAAQAEGKSTVGGDPGAALPPEFSVVPAALGGRPAPVARTEVLVRAPRQSEHIRAPPRA
ncbi:hypothetical protein J2Z31_002201 [Sinorhizobium kostiense]|uniref:Uncharacterized protein n=1 Tax=Sinorhizobium kostiense TaxID=76747 RepID=A0ABS4R035_9HYPH|nr:hypothetical protein [Sinorhizobium kostiense]MBP2235709.1 hypothetical protein [Sinorhizobium kostiense]